VTWGATADAARTLLSGALRSPEPAPTTASPLGLAVAHAHIDTAWLWPVRETRRKIIRSWTNALEVLDSNRDAVFICSQAQQYEYLRAGRAGRLRTRPRTRRRGEVGSRSARCGSSPTPVFRALNR
jgi:hypothetical protein